jgi:hypothetical protein
VTRALDDPRLVRRLLRACRRAGSTLRRSSRPRGENSPAVMTLLRLLFSVGFAIAVAKLAERAPLAAQVLPLSAMATACIGISVWRARLRGALDLGVLAQLPVTDEQVFDRQSAGLWRVAAWSSVDVIVFWSVVWPADRTPWLLLPLIGAANGLLTMAAVVLLMRWLPARAGWFTAAIIGLAGGMIVSKGAILAWPGVPQVFEAVRQFTPWGWITILAAKAPQEPTLAICGVGAVICLSTVASNFGWRRLRAGWRRDPAWREVAGTSMHALFTESVQEFEQEAPANAASDAPAVGRERTGVLDAWRAARRAPVDAPLVGLGWVGRQAGSAFDRGDRFMVGVLHPRGPSNAAWVWAMLSTGSCAAAATFGFSPTWAIVVLGLAFLIRGKRVAAVLVAAVAGLAGIYHDCAVIIFVVQVFVGLAIMIPFLGGSWGGLPQTVSPLGSLPRRWASLHRLMVIILAWRLVAALPVAGLAGLALGLGVAPVAGILAIMAWAACALVMPWLVALRLNSMAPNGLDIDYGWSWRTVALVGLVLAQGLAIVTAGVGFLLLFSEQRLEGASALGGGLAVAAAVAIALVRLLGDLYRRRVDLIARPAG